MAAGKKDTMHREDKPMSVTRHESHGILSPVVEGGGLVFTAGITADDFSLGVTGQTEQVLKEIDRLLALAGSDKSKILSATIWVPDIRLRDDMNIAWNSWTGGENLPARACIEAKLANPAILVEIAVVAVK